MYNLELTRKSEEKLDFIKSTNLDLFNLIILELQELKTNFTNSNNIKNIWNWIFRKRVWRWRILFTKNNDIITIWIIDIEKDTQKDYKKWKEYIISKM